MSEDWMGPITDPAVNMRFVEAFSNQARHGAVRVFVCDQWPPETVGVLDGNPCMSPDMHALMMPARVTPEAN